MGNNYHDGIIKKYYKIIYKEYSAFLNQQG